MTKMKNETVRDNMRCIVRVNFRISTLHKLYERLMAGIRYLSKQSCFQM